MGSVPFAFSVHHFISSVGADAGFAAIIGLAMLVLLYFAQARETATLREQAEEAEQRVQYLEGRLAQVARSQAAASASTTAPGRLPVRPSRLHVPGHPARACHRDSGAGGCRRLHPGNRGLHPGCGCGRHPRRGRARGNGRPGAQRRRQS